MEFLCKIVMLTALLVSCGKASSDQEFIIGTPIDQGTDGTLQSFEEGGKVYFSTFDQLGGRLNFVDPAAQTLSFSPRLGNPGNAWLATKDDRFAFHVSVDTVQIQTSAFQTSTPILKLTGTIKSWAVDFPQGYFAFVDEYFSIGLLQIDGSGQVLKAWTGGPIINGLKTVIAGEMVDGGKLLLLVDDGTLIVVDVAASLEAKAWKFEQRTLAFNKPSWIGKIEGNGTRAMIYDSIGLHLVDLTNDVILQSVAIRSYVTPSKNGLDHVYYYDYTTQNLAIVRPDGPDRLLETRVKLVDEKVSQTYLSSNNLTVSTASLNVLRFRLSDGLNTGKYTLKGNGRLGLSDSYAVAMYDSALGAIEIINLENGQSKMFQSFNLPVLQD